MSHRRSLLIKRPSAGGFAFNNALAFRAASNEHVTFTAIATTNTFTFSGWFYFDSTGVKTLLGSSASAFHYITMTNSTTFQVRLSSIRSFTVTAINTGQWYHLAFTSSASVTDMYVDSVKQTSSSTTGGVNIDMVGNRSGLTSKFDGKSDELIFKVGYTATQADIDDLYNSGNGVDSSTILTSPDFHYKFDESGTDIISVDDSGNSNNGTLNNFPASGMWVPH